MITIDIKRSHKSNYTDFISIEIKKDNHMLIDKQLRNEPKEDPFALSDFNHAFTIINELPDMIGIITRAINDKEKMIINEQILNDEGHLVNEKKTIYN